VVFEGLSIEKQNKSISIFSSIDISAVIYGGSSRKHQIFQCETGFLSLSNKKII